jgi:hypothetical protein
MGQTSVLILSIGPHIAVTEAKEEHIKANLSKPPLGDNNHLKEAKMIEALLEFE